MTKEKTMRFTKKPVTVDAIRWTGKNTPAVKAWVTSLWHKNAPGNMNIPANYALFVKRRGSGMTETLWQTIADENWGPDITAAVFDYLHESYVGVKTGQWIICGTEGEYYPCADDGTGDAPLNYAPEVVGQHTGLLDNIADTIAECGRECAYDAREALGVGNHPQPSGASVRGALLQALAPLLAPDPTPTSTEPVEWTDVESLPANGQILVNGEWRDAEPLPVTPLIEPWMLPFMEFVLGHVPVLDFDGVAVPPRLKSILNHAVDEGRL